MQDLLYSRTELVLAKRLEAGHASSGLAVALESEPIAGGRALFHGINSPGTQALAIGMDCQVTDQELDRLETFFRDRHTPVVIDLCSLADATLRGRLEHRGYAIREVTNVFVHEIGSATLPVVDSSPITFEPVLPGEHQDWARLVIQSFSGLDQVPEDEAASFASTVQNIQAYFALYNNHRVGACAMDVHDGLATLFGDATLPAARCQGIQIRSIYQRVFQARQLGCDLASASVLPSSGSQRNYERAGFRFVYQRTMMAL